MIASKLTSMKMDDAKYAAVLERREARARRSKKLGRVIFLCVSVGMTLTLRMNPALSAEIADYFVKASTKHAATLPATSPISSMPLNRVKVRKGIENKLDVSTQKTQTFDQDIVRKFSRVKAEL